MQFYLQYYLKKNIAVKKPHFILLDTDNKYP